VGRCESRRGPSRRNAFRPLSVLSACLRCLNPGCLADARKLIISLQEPRAAHPNWQLASDLLLAAAGDEIAWDKVGIQLRVALKAEGLI
jgi:hypothetical protein